MIIQNVGKKQIMITTQWHADEFGGPAIQDHTISFGPGEKIDLCIIDAKVVGEDDMIKELVAALEEERFLLASLSYLFSVLTQVQMKELSDKYQLELNPYKWASILKMQEALARYREFWEGKE